VTAALIRPCREAPCQHVVLLQNLAIFLATSDDSSRANLDTPTTELLHNSAPGIAQGASNPWSEMPLPDACTIQGMTNTSAQSTNYLADPLKWARDNAVLVAVVGGLLYALGFYVIGSAYSQLGVGPIEVPREACVAAGLVLLTGALPFLALIWLVLRYDLRPFVLLGIASLATLMGFGILVTWTGLLSTAHGPRVWTAYPWGLLASAAVPLGLACFLAVPWAAVRKHERSGSMWAGFGTTVLSAAICSFSTAGYPLAFSRSVAPNLGPSFGGFTYRRVRVGLKEPEQTLDLIAIVSDSHALIGSDHPVHPTDWSRGAGPSLVGIKRIPWDRIVSLETLGP
jgi:hypothetical protein